MQIKFLPSARSGLLWFRAYYAEVFPAGEANAGKHYKLALNTPGAHPLAGKLVNEAKQLRELGIPRTPFSFLYTIRGEYIFIVRVKDGRQGT